MLSNLHQRAHPDPTAFCAALRGEPVAAENWPSVMARAFSEGVLPFVAAQNADCPDRATIRRQASLHHLARIALVRRVAGALHTVAIPWVTIKGLSIATLLYVDPADRPSGDCDILVRPQDREEASDALQKAGFLPTSHHRELFVGELGEVDLHTHFVNQERVPSRGALAVSEPDWPNEITRLETEAGTLPVLSDRHLAIFLALHLVHHHGAVGARWHTDLRLLLRAHPEFGEIITTQCGRGGTTALHANLALFGPTLGIILPAPTFGDRLVARAAFEGVVAPGLRFLLTLRDLPTTASQWTFLVQTLTPRREVLDAVTATSPQSGLLTHIKRLAKTTFSLTGLAGRTFNRKP